MTASPLQARIEERASLAKIVVASEVLRKLETYCTLLQEWNGTVNLTALPLASFPAETLDRLIVEPLIAATILQDVSGRWIDVGSGGGSPALPLKIVRPDLDLALVESNHRKCAFLNEAIRTLQLVAAKVVGQRFEERPAEDWGQIDLITIRAVRPDASLLSTVHRSLRPGGVFLFFGAVDDDKSKEFEANFFKSFDRPLYPSRGVITRLLNR